MKKILMSLCSLLFIITWVKAQNQYPTEKNSSPVIDGGSIEMIKPSMDGAWAKGLFYKQTLNSPIAAGIGAFGIGNDYHYLYFGINNSPWGDSKGMFLRDNGYLGIGTGTPRAKLEVIGNFFLTPNDNSNGGIQFFADGGIKINSTNDYLLSFIDFKAKNNLHKELMGRFAYLDGHGFQFIHMNNNNEYTHLVDILESGNVGIGARDPIHKLEVYGGKLGQEKGSEVPIAAFISHNANHSKLMLKQIRWANDNGWISASTRLQLITDITPQGYIEFNSIPPSGVGVSGNHRYDKVGITMGHGDQEYFRMNHGNGFIGLGTNDPDERLTVKGKIHAEEVKIDLQVPADYVFQKYYTGRSSLKEEYKLPSLEEVEKYTRENHHLPEIPSAKEIQENGLQLGEMTNLLLQKIEEMTIYIIEQQKQIEQLKQIIDSQNK